MITTIMILTEVTDLGMVPGRVTCHFNYDTVFIATVEQSLDLVNFITVFTKTTLEVFCVRLVKAQKYI